MSNLNDNNPPYHLVLKVPPRKHCGPFSTYLDATLARTLSTVPELWEVMNCEEFEAYLGISK
jgi:hypothetical protein